MELKVRPFEKVVENRATGKSASFNGRIAGAEFVVCMAGYEVPVPILRAGEDSDGPYAIRRAG